MILLTIEELAWGEDSCERPSAGAELALHDHAIADRDVPLFALLRSTMGLPDNNSNWWPKQPGRRRRGSFAALTSDDHHSSVGRRRAVPAIDVGVPWENTFAHPTVALLERTLAGLRTWTGVSSTAHQSQDLTHHLSGLAGAR